MKALASTADITGPAAPVIADKVAGRFAWGVCPVLVNDAREALVGVSGCAVAAAPPPDPPPILPDMVGG